MHLSVILLGFVAAIALLFLLQGSLPRSQPIARVSLVLTRVLGAIALSAGACLLALAAWLLLKGETDWSLGCLVFGLLFAIGGITSLRLKRPQER